MNFILFNGPPRSGKDTAAKIAFDYVSAKVTHFAVWEKFSFPNKRGFAGMVNVMCDEWGTVLPFEERKDTSWDVLGASYRQWQIDFSEAFMKPFYGYDVFGRLLLHRCKAVQDDVGTGFTPIFIVSDCGFQIECDVLREHNVLLIRMNRERTSYAGDSRQTVNPHTNWQTCDMGNNLDLNDLKANVEAEVAMWLPA